jgi:hypothetical protein
MADRAFQLGFGYEGTKRFLCSGDFVQNHALLEADFGTGVTALPIAVGLLSPEAALGEAMFF